MRHQDRLSGEDGSPADSMLALVEEMTDVGHWHLEVATGILRWSDQLFRIQGLTPSTCRPDLERTIASFHPDDRPQAGRIIAAAIAEASRFEFGARIECPDGSVRDVVCRGRSDTDATGAVKTVFGTVLDVTALRVVERAALESETRFRHLAEATSDVITRVGPDFTRDYVSPACRRVFGFTPEDMLGKRPSDSMHPDDVERVREVARCLVAGETAEERVTVEYRTRHKRGHYVWVEAGMSLSRSDGDGGPAALICSLRDITERRRAATALEASEARYRALAENTSELIMLGHDDGRRTYVSPASQRLLGFSPGEMLSMSMKDHVHPDDLARLFATTRRLMTDGEASIVYRARHKTRGWLFVEGVFRRIGVARGDEPTIVATFRDVSEREAQSVALREAKEMAEAAQKAAEQASVAKSDFLASMSHEIRTPLNGIIGYADLLMEDPGLDAGRRRKVERIQGAGAALLTVVNDILDFSKIEAGQVDLQPAAFRLASLLEGAVSIVTGVAEAKRLDLSVSVAPCVPGLLLGDADRIRQVLLNLLNNAVKFTTTGTVALSVEILPNATTLRFAVTDTGIGIPVDKRSRLFQRFSQVDGSIGREFGGTGLGLAICKSLIELMGGSIGVETSAGGGSRFWFDLDLPVASEHDLRSESPANRRGARCGAYVLLVEDLEINQDLARAVIETAGHRVDVVGDGAEAVAAVANQTYDLVLMDVQMPGMDGLAATKAIRLLPGPASRVPIVAMTANVLPDQIARFRSAGMDGHVGKPFRRHELCGVIEAWAKAGHDMSGSGPAPRYATELDEGARREMTDLLGKEAVAGLVKVLADQIRDCFADEKLAAQNRAVLARDAHALVSAAAMLGFRGFSELCGRLETACKDDLPLGALLDEMRSAKVRMRAAIAEIGVAA